MKFKKTELVYVLYMVLIVFILSLIVASIEVFIVAPTNKEIGQISKEIEFLEGIDKKNEYYDLLFNVLYSGGLNLEAEREKIQLDRIGAYSIGINQLMQQAVVASCENINHAYNYTGIIVNCSEVDSWGGLPNQDEIQKIGEARTKLYGAYLNLKMQKGGLDSKEEKWSAMRNFLYVFLIVASGIGTAFKYFLDKKLRKSP